MDMVKEIKKFIELFTTNNGTEWEETDPAKVWQYFEDNYLSNQVEAGVSVRPSVMKFAEIMEQKLKLNDHKGGWGNCTNDYLFDRMEQEIIELNEYFVWDEKKQDYICTYENSDFIKSEAADIANFAMMIADNIGE